MHLLNVLKPVLSSLRVPSFLLLLLSPLSGFSDGPGVPSITFAPSQTNAFIKTFTVNDIGLRPTYAGMTRGYLVVAGGNFAGEADPYAFVSSWDLTNPTNPVKIASVQDNELFKTHAMGFHKDLFTVRAGGFRLYDISNPTNHIKRGITYGGTASSLSTFYAHPYVYRGGEGYGDNTGWLTIHDVSDPDSPRLLSDIDMPNLVGFRIGAMTAMGNVLVVSASQSDGVVTMDISDPKNPQLLGVARHSGEFTYTAIAHGTKVYNGDGNGFLSIYDFSDKHNPVYVTNVNCGGSVRYPILQDNFIHIGNIGNARYQKIDLNTHTLAIDQPVPQASSAPEIAVPLGNMVFIGGSINAGPLAEVGYIMVHQLAPDTTGPSVNGVRPLDNESGVAVTSMIGISLTDLLDPRTLNTNTFIVRPVGESALEGDYTTQAGIVNFVPSEPLPANTTFEVVVTSGGIKDLSGNGVPTTFTSTFSTGSSGVRDDNMTRLWKLNGDAKESLANQSSTNNAVTFGSGVDGNGGIFNGSASIDIAPYSFGNEFTISAWAYVDGAGSGPQTIVANAGSATSANGFKFFINRRSTADGTLIFETGNGSASLAAESSTGAVPDNTWVQVAAVINRTAGTARLFVNNAEVTSSSAIRTDFAINQVLHLGSASGSAFRLTGQLDNIRFYQRELSLSDLTRIYNHLDDLFMTHRWRFNGNLLDGAGSRHGSGHGVTFESGKEDEAVYLHGTNFVALGKLNVGQTFTVSGWVWIDSGTTNIQTFFANGPGGGAGDGFQLFVNGYNTADGAVVMESGDGTTGTSGRTTTNAVPVDTWTHITAVVDRGVGSVRFFVNGDDKTSTTNVNKNFGTNQAAYFGSFSSTAWKMKGRLDDMQFYPRALSASEVGVLYSTSVPAGLTHRWRLDGNANDSVGSNDGTVNGATFTTGRENQGASFDGSDDIDVGTLSLASNATITAWVYLSPSVTGSQTILANKGTDTASGYAFYVNSDGTSDLKLGLQTGNGSTSANVITTSAALTAGAWHQVVAVVNVDAGTVRFFVNGVAKPATGAVAPGFALAQGTVIGSRTGGTLRWNGSLDEVCLFERTLGSSELLRRYVEAPNTPPEISSITSSKSPAQTHTSVTFTATASDDDEDALLYSFDFGDNTAASAWSSSSSVAHTYTTPGRFTVTARVKDGSGNGSRTRTQVAYNAPNSIKPTSSTAITFDSSRNKVWNVNPDTDSVTRIDVATLARDFEVAVGTNPVSIAINPAFSQVWVACAQSDEVKILNAGTGALINTINTGYGSHPTDVVFSPDGSGAFVALRGKPRIVRFNPSSLAKIAETNLPGIPKGLSISSNSQRLFIGRHISAPGEGQVWELVATNLATTRVFAIQKDVTTSETGSSGRGLPNYLVQMQISPDGRRLWVPSKKDNIVRGQYRTGQDLLADSTVRSMLSKIDLTTNAPNNNQTLHNTLTGVGVTPPVTLVTNQDLLAERKDVDNRELPHGIVFSPVGDLAFVAYQGNNLVTVFDSSSNAELFGLNLGTGRAPQGVTINTNGTRLFVHNFMSRSVSVVDVSGVVSGSSGSMTLVTNIATITTEKLSASVLNGKTIFYNAADTRMGTDGYMSCATCHLGGGQDGQVWDFTQRGEGLRNTITLLGQGGVANGRVHWSANFDEIQDFELDIRNGFGGTGFISGGTPHSSLGTANAGRSTELDDLAAYVSSLTTVGRSPYRTASGALTADAIEGKKIFTKLNCQSCHSGANFTDSPSAVLHHVGTIKDSSGKRLGTTLTGLDTPTLKGLWDTAPYLHDGSAATMLDVITTANPNNHHGNTSLLTPIEQTQLVTYLLSIDDAEPAVTTGGTSVVPAAPEFLTATAVSASAIHLAWTDRANNETGFRIERRIGEQGPFVQIADVAPNGTFHADQNLAPNTLYVYRVRPYNATGDGGNSNEARARTAGLLTSAQTAAAAAENEDEEAGAEGEAELATVPYLRIVPEGTRVVLYWPTKSGKQYWLQSKTDLSVPWPSEGQFFPGTGGINSYSEKVEMGEARKFYRILER